MANFVVLPASNHHNALALHQFKKPIQNQIEISSKANPSN
jgi:hypothetical protein